MREAIFFEAKTVGEDVAELENKVRLCREFGWTPEQYDRQKVTELRKIKNYLKWMEIKSASRGSL